MKNKHIVHFLMVFIVATWNLQSQLASKKNYSPELDTSWSRSVIYKDLSQDGNWLMVEESFDHKKDLLKLISINDSLEIDMTDTKSESFTSDSKYMSYMSQSKNLVIFDLNNLTSDTIHNISSYKFSNSGDLVSYIQNSQLVIREIKGTILEIFNGVNQYKWHPQKPLLVFNTKINERNHLYEYAPLEKKLSDSKKEIMGNLKFLDWDKQNRLCALSKTEGGNKKLNFFMEGFDSFSLSDSTLATIEPGYKISDRNMFVDTLNQRVFFYREEIYQVNPDVTKYEIWSTSDPWIQPKMKQYRKYELGTLLTVWYPLTGKILAVETSALPRSSLNIHHKYALVFNPLDYEPLYKHHPNADIYLKNLKTGTLDLVCDNQYTNQKFIKISPSGKYITYFSKKQWFLYDVNTGVTKSLTSSIQSSFVDTEFDMPGDPLPYGQAGWTDDEAYVMVYDKYHIWLISPDDLNNYKITQDLNDGLVHRMDFLSTEYPSNGQLHRGYLSRLFNLKKPHVVLVSDEDRKSWGFTIWKMGQPMEPSTVEETKIEPLKLFKGSSKVLVKKEKYNSPPSFYMVDNNTNKQKLIYQSNKTLLDYDLGEAKIIEYTVGDGVSQRGTLMYPSNFDKNKTYPILVHIYERELKTINHFISPSIYNHAGFNRLKFLTEGYFVFYPNIIYNEGEPAVSALRCVESAVKKVLEESYIDRKRVGLIGHSFGGYETAYIVARSNMFSMAIIGAGAFDLFSHYHDISWDDKSSKFYKFENLQLRMGGSFYEMKKAFFNNSPSIFVEGIDIPILIWSGKKDTIVNWNQSIYMFMAMKRLKKNAKLILFENEGHYLTDSLNQKKLFSAIKGWINTHL